VAIRIWYVNLCKINCGVLTKLPTDLYKPDTKGAGIGFPINMNTAGGILIWLYLDANRLLVTGRICAPGPGKEKRLTSMKHDQSDPAYPLEDPSARLEYQKPYGDKDKFDELELNTDMLFGIAEILRNETARDILHSIKMPEKTEFDGLVPPRDRKYSPLTVLLSIIRGIRSKLTKS
jgi:hypothetical protein